LDNEGNALVAGQLYWNTSAGALRVYDGTTWQNYNPTAGVTGQSSSVDSEIALFDGTSGKAIKRANQTGVLKATSGVISTASSSDITSLVDAASDTAAGKVELATAAEVATGTDNTRAATPSGISNSAIFGIIPVESKTADYTLTASDQSKLIFHSGTDANNRTFTIPANASVAFPIGTVITFANRINTVTISITSDTLVWAPSGATGTRTLAANGIATATKLTSTLWMISGAGLS
jgi:hypothetical protein